MNISRDKMVGAEENTSGDQSYSEQEVQQILQFAISKQSYQGGFNRQQLLEMAKELDISPETLEQAEKDYWETQVLTQQRQAFDKARWNKCKQHAGTYVIVNAFLMTLNFVINNTISWSLFPLLGWGVGLAFDFWECYTLEGEDYEDEFQKWLNKQEKRRKKSKQK